MKLAKLYAACASAITLGLALPTGAQEANDMSEQARYATSALASTMPTLVVMDKARGELLIVENGTVIMRSPALYGKGAGEDEGEDRNVTPAGIFTLQEYSANSRQYEGGRVLAFLCQRAGCYVIHPTWNGAPAERRNERLASPSVEDNAISNGCINVPTEFYQRMSEFLRSRTSVTMVNGQQVIAMPRLLVLPENTDPEATRRILNLPMPGNAPVLN